MKNTILTVCGAVLVAGLTASAQQPPQQTPPPPQTPPTQQPPPTQQTPPAQPAPRPDPYPATPSTRAPGAMVENTMTLTGCLKTWDSRTMAPATGAGSGAGSAAAPVASAPASTGASSEFVLTNVERSEAARAAGVTGSSYLLKASDSSVAFNEHLNHKVSLTGSISDAARDLGRPTDRSADRADKPAPDPSGRAGDAKLPTLNVTSLKMVSPTCGS